METVKLSIVEFHILKYLIEHEGQTVLIKNIAAAIHITYQTVSRHVNRFINSGDISRNGKQFTVINPYFREAIRNG